jgi:PTS system mannitol-specific IIC component
MKPVLILALIAGGMTGVTTNMVLGGALRAPAAPGSIIAVIAQTASGAYFAVILSVILSAAVTFVIAAVILRASRKRDLAAMAATDDAFGAAITQTEAAKGKSSDALSNLRGGAATSTGGGVEPAVMTERTISNIVFACDAGMGSSAMGASVLRNKIKKAGIEDVTVTNKAIAALDGSADLVITQNQLTDRARQKTPEAIHVSVDNFMNSPKYEEVVDLVRAQHKDGA